MGIIYGNQGPNKTLRSLGPPSGLEFLKNEVHEENDDESPEDNEDDQIVKDIDYKLKIEEETEGDAVLADGRMSKYLKRNVPPKRK